MERKFNISAIIFSAAALLLAFFTLSAEAVAAGIVGIVLAVSKRKTHLIKLPIFLSVIAILASIAWVIGIIALSQQDSGHPAADYWLFNLIFTSKD